LLTRNIRLGLMPEAGYPVLTGGTDTPEPLFVVYKVGVGFMEHNNPQLRTSTKSHIQWGWRGGCIIVA
jgi:hypothetical protein